MERFTKSRLFTYGIYTLLGLLILYMLLLIKPLIVGVYDFLKAVLAPFIIAMIISYVLNPIVGLLKDRKVPRTMAVLLIYAVFLTTMTVIIMNLIPMFMKQLQELNEHIPELTMRAQSIVEDLNQSFLPQGVRTGIMKWTVQLENKLAQSISDFMNNIGATLNVLFIAFIIPFLIFYILKDFDVFERTALKYVPKSHRKHTVMLLKDIDEALGNYIRGQFIVCFIIGILAYLGYWIIGMPYPLLLAAVVAICNIIPYLGPFLGAAPAIIMASTISLKMVLLVALVNMICQILESNVISPQVVGRTLHLHPLLIIFALLVGGEIAGVIGLILAVPFFAAMKVILQHIFTYYVRRKTI
ncbi:Putative transport protein YhhT [Paenibacillus sp. CECT 9249]|uniref:AI-2E family transporter n=1 Tax=Paenibacillus sp. CECT 9249 TaxID=2845385 RepID=UPI001E496EAE|nr:AI-2E family transporter [Paenibacillus sp. CECT 9249]CAH0119063.1 Putative transport protein YhhT [Paenibacillus sp. CECT 9249]